MSLKPATRAALAAGLALAPLACGPPSMISDRDEAVPIPRGASWAWAAPDTGEQWQRDPVLGNEITHQRYTRAIEATMEDKGFRRADAAAEADFLLSYHMGSRHAGPTGTTGVAMVGVGGWGWGRPGYGYGGYGHGYGWPGWGWGLYGPPMYAGVTFAGPGAVPYRDGALVILLRQRESGHVAWEVRYALDPYETQRVTQQRVQEIVNALFSSLP